jgi:hypothetical protein
MSYCFLRHAMKAADWEGTNVFPRKEATLVASFANEIR